MSNSYIINNNIYLELSSARASQLSGIVKTIAKQIEDGLGLRVSGCYLKMLDQPRVTLTRMELEVLSKISQIVRHEHGGISSKSLEKELAVIKKLRKIILSEIKQDDETLTAQITQINKGIKIEGLLKGFTAKEACKWIIKNPAAKNLEIADFRGFGLNNLNNDCLKDLTEACPNLKHLFIGNKNAKTTKITGDALKYLERLPNLESLSIAYLRNLDPDALKNLMHTPFLKFLDITCCRSLEPDSLKNLKYIKELQTLKAKLAGLSKDALKNLTHVRKLLHLNISHNSDLDPEALENLIFIPNLLNLNIASCEKLIADSLKCLVHISHLQILNISGCRQFGADCLKYLEHIRDLQKLKIKFCWQLELDALKNLKYVQNLKIFILTSCYSLESDALKNLVHVPFLLELCISNCTQLEADALKHVKHTIHLQKLNTQSCYKLENNPFEPLLFTPDLECLDFSSCNQIEAYALKPLIFHAHLRDIKHTYKTIKKDYLQLAFERDTLAPLTDMSDWGNFIVRDSNWDNLNIYNANGTQEPYGRRMQQAVVIVTDLVKNNASFSDVCKCARALRHINAIELGHVKAPEFGEPRRTIYQTDVKQLIYNDIGTVWKEKDEDIKNSPAVNPFYNPDKAMVMGEINGKQLELSFVNLQTMMLYHTDPSLIPEIMEYVENELYPLAIKEKDPLKVHEIVGLIFWWICQAKPWLRGDPSIAEIIFRAIFASKQIPNLPWKEKLVPWGEATKEFDPNTFSQNFHTLFDKA